MSSALGVQSAFLGAAVVAADLALPYSPRSRSLLLQPAPAGGGGSGSALAQWLAAMRAVRSARLHINAQPAARPCGPSAGANDADDDGALQATILPVSTHLQQSLPLSATSAAPSSAATTSTSASPSSLEHLPPAATGGGAPARIGVRLSWRLLGPALVALGASWQWGPFQAGLLIALLAYPLASLAHGLACVEAAEPSGLCSHARLMPPLERAVSVLASFFLVGLVLVLWGSSRGV